MERYGVEHVSLEVIFESFMKPMFVCYERFSKDSIASCENRPDHSICKFFLKHYSLYLIRLPMRCSLCINMATRKCSLVFK